MDGDQTAPSAQIKRKKKTGMVNARKQLQQQLQPPQGGSDDPSKAPSDPELPEAPEFSEI